MGFFGEKTSLGVDIGPANIKIVELVSSQGMAELLTYGAIDIGEDIMKSDDRGSNEKIAEALRDLLTKSKVKSRQVVSALPGFSVFNSVIKLPEMNESEIASAVKWEARRYVPFPIENMVLDWKQLKEEYQETSKPKDLVNQRGEIRVLLTAAPKSLVNKYLEIFSIAGLKLKSLETESFALMRSLVGNDKSTIVVVNIGSTATDISVMSNGLPVLNRSFDIGGRAITSSIASSLNVGLDRAEQFKRDLSLSSKMGDEVPDVIKPIIQSIANEIKNALSLYSESGGKAIEKIILTGGSSKLVTLPKYLKESLGLEVFLGNPWARIKYPKGIEQELKNISPMFSVCAGLALRDM